MPFVPEGTVGHDMFHFFWFIRNIELKNKTSSKAERIRVMPANDSAKGRLSVGNRLILSLLIAF
jgi:hypothetical protein